MWKRLCATSELNLAKTLKNGQSFRWKQTASGVFVSSIRADFMLLLKELADDNESLVQYQARDIAGEPLETSEIDALVRSYFHLEVSVADIYRDFRQDTVFAKSTKGGQFDAIRLLRIDPTENLCSFLTSQNNNIKRISQLIDALCFNFGKLVGRVEEVGQEPIEIYSFPRIEDLVGTEAKLREIGFGYRAKYIDRTASELVAKANAYPSIAAYLDHVRINMSYEEAKLDLLQLTGIGPKVADCICLFSLDKHEAIPVDTHVKSIAIKSYGYKFGTVTKTITPQDYLKIQQIFQTRFGKYCGWAHSVLFTADLSYFADEGKENNPISKKRKLN